MVLKQVIGGVFLVLLSGCMMQETKPPQQEPCVSAKDVKSGEKSEFLALPLWADSLARQYVYHSGNELIDISLKENMGEAWELDRVEKTDTVTWFVLHFGHEMRDSGNINPRFATDGWVYIDSLSRKLYALDVARDQLIEWKKGK